jgi:nicotinamide riboside transporter PnuC
MNMTATTKPEWQAKVSPFLTLLGWILIVVSFVIGLFILTPTVTSYWGESAKATRDAAGAGTLLIGQLQTLSATPFWLEPLTFVGVAAFIVGIALEFSTIPAILRKRGRLMKQLFPTIVRHSM